MNSPPKPKSKMDLQAAFSSKRSSLRRNIGAE
jgi:hypothetical protein